MSDWVTVRVEAPPRYPIVAYKGRSVDLSRHVEVYRNLRDTGGRWSIRQGRLVVAHANALALARPTFHVVPSGLARMRRTGHRGVCAYATGDLVDEVFGIAPQHGRVLSTRVHFDTDCGCFAVRSEKHPFRIERAMSACFNEHGCTVEFPVLRELKEPRQRKGPTKSLPVRLSVTRRTRWEELAHLEGCALAETIRRAVDEKCDRMLSK